VDLQSLKIERQPKKASRARRNPWPLRVAFGAALAAIAWFVWPLASALYDRISLPEVRTLVVREAAPAAAAAVRGTSANGYVVAARRAALSSDVPGRIVELNVQEGSEVKQGDIVARLFSDEYRAAWQRAVFDHEAAEVAARRAQTSTAVADAEVTQAETVLATAEALRDEGTAQLDYAEKELLRVVELTSTGIENVRRRQTAERDRDAARARLVSLEATVATRRAGLQTAQQRASVARADVEAARAQAQAAAATRDQAKATLDKTDVRAPFDGVVVLKDAEVGEVVSPNVQGGSNARGAVCTMVDFDSLEVQANVPENTLASVELGAPADVFLDAFPDDRYEGVVDRIWPTADRQKATVEVRIKLQQRDRRLRPEMGVRIVFRKEPRPSSDDAEPVSDARRIVVPEEALVQIGGKTGAFVVERDTVRFAVVTAGERKSGRVAIDAGLTANQRIVLDPPTTLQDGDRVRTQAN